MGDFNNLLPKLLAEVRAWESIQLISPESNNQVQFLLELQNQLLDDISSFESRVEAITSVTNESIDLEPAAAAIREAIAVLVKEKTDDVEQLLNESAQEAIEERQEKIDNFVGQVVEAIDFLTSFVDETISVIEEKAAVVAELANVDFESIKDSIYDQLDLTTIFKEQLTERLDLIRQKLLESIGQVGKDVESTIGEVQATGARLAELVNQISSSLASASAGMTSSAGAIDASKEAITSPL